MPMSKRFADLFSGISVPTMSQHAVHTVWIDVIVSWSSSRRAHEPALLPHRIVHRNCILCEKIAAMLLRNFIGVCETFQRHVDNATDLYPPAHKAHTVHLQGLTNTTCCHTMPPPSHGSARQAQPMHHARCAAVQVQECGSGVARLRRSSVQLADHATCPPPPWVQRARHGHP